jgi:hypothetical protein
MAGIRVARELSRLIDLRSPSQMNASDNGTELTSQAILKCNRPVSPPLW